MIILQPQYSYIAHCTRVPAYVKEFQERMIEKGYPCLLSNQVEENYLNPQELANSRLENLQLPQNRLFFFFLDESSKDQVALIEFGISLTQKNFTICVIGEDRTNSFQYLPDKVEYFKTPDEFFIVAQI